jgi:choline kinase
LTTTDHHALDTKQLNGSRRAATGLVLAAGAGRRLRPFTDCLPKTLVELGDGSTVLERILGNFATVGIDRATIVVGYCGSAIRSRLAELEEASGLQLDLVDNPHGETRNNAYSLWCARHALSEGALLVNGDTLHPASVQNTLLSRAGDRITLAIDVLKVLGDEEMKVEADGGRLTAIGKPLPHDSFGEYIGVAWVPPAAAHDLVDALERVWRRDSNAFYEAAFQEMVMGGAAIDLVPIGDVNWIEIDNLDDLARANQLICLS